MSIRELLKIEVIKNPSNGTIAGLQLLTLIGLILVAVSFRGDKNIKATLDPETRQILVQQGLEASQYKREGLENKEAEFKKLTDFLIKKDSLNKVLYDNQYNTLIKSQKESNEKINNISKFGSDDIRSAFAELTK